MPVTIEERQTTALNEMGRHVSAYSGWTEEEIRANVEEVLQSGDETRINRMGAALTKMPVYTGWSQAEVIGNVKEVFQPEAEEEQKPSVWSRIADAARGLVKEKEPEEPYVRPRERVQKPKKEAPPAEEPAGEDLARRAQRGAVAGAAAPEDQPKMEEVTEEPEQPGIGSWGRGVMTGTAQMKERIGRYLTTSRKNLAEQILKEGEALVEKHGWGALTMTEKTRKAALKRFKTIGVDPPEWATLKLTRHEREAVAFYAESDAVRKNLDEMAADLQKQAAVEVPADVEEAQRHITSKEALDPRKVGKTLNSAVTVAMQQLPNLVGSFVMPGATMFMSEAGAFMDAAEAAGMEDEDLIQWYSEMYAMPSAALEFGMALVLTAPVRKAIGFVPGAKRATKRVAAHAAKHILMRIAGKGLVIAGRGAMEGLEEMTQGQLQNMVLFLGLGQEAQKYPERAEALQAKQRQLLDKVGPNGRPFMEWLLEYAPDFIIGTVAGVFFAGLGEATGAGIEAQRQAGAEAREAAQQATEGPSDAQSPKFKYQLLPAGAQSLEEWNAEIPILSKLIEQEVAKADNAEDAVDAVMKSAHSMGLGSVEKAEYNVITGIHEFIKDRFNGVVDLTLEQAEKVEAPPAAPAPKPGEVGGPPSEVAAAALEAPAPFSEEEWIIEREARGRERVTLDQMAAEKVEAARTEGRIVSIADARAEADRESLNQVTKEPSIVHYNTEWAAIESQKPIQHETVQFYHKHGDELGMVYGWMEKGKQHALVASGDMPGLGAFNETEMTGHGWTNNLLRKYMPMVHQFLRWSPRMKQATTVEQKVKAFHATVVELKQKMDRVKVPLPNGKKVHVGLNVGIGTNPTTAEKALLQVGKEVGRNSLRVDESLGTNYDVSDVQGTDLTVEYYEAGLRGDKLEARYAEAKAAIQQGRLPRGTGDRGLGVAAQAPTKGGAAEAGPGAAAALGERPLTAAPGLPIAEGARAGETRPISPEEYQREAGEYGTVDAAYEAEIAETTPTDDDFAWFNALPEERAANEADIAEGEAALQEFQAEETAAVAAEEGAPSEQDVERAVTTLRADLNKEIETEFSDLTRGERNKLKSWLVQDTSESLPKLLPNVPDARSRAQGILDRAADRLNRDDVTGRQQFGDDFLNQEGQFEGDAVRDMLSTRAKQRRKPRKKAPPRFKQRVYQGRGAPLEQVYGKEAVAEGRAVPLLGPAQYYAFSEKEARTYGEVSPADVELRNPYVLDSDAKWFELLDDADAQHLNNMARLFYEDPKGILPATKKLQRYLRSLGHDGVVVRLSETTDKTKRLNAMFGHDQVVAFGRRAAAPAVAAKKPAAPPVEEAAAPLPPSPPQAQLEKDDAAEQQIIDFDEFTKKMDQRYDEAKKRDKRRREAGAVRVPGRAPLAPTRATGRVAETLEAGRAEGPGVIARVAASLGRMGTALREHVTEFRGQVKGMPQFRDDLRTELTPMRRRVIDRVQKWRYAVLRPVYANEGKKGLQTVTDILILRDLEQRAKEGQTLPNDLTAQEVTAHLVRTEKAASPEVVAAAGNLQEVMQALGAELVRRGKIRAPRGNYFPHSVLDYTPDWMRGLRFPMKRKAKMPYRGYTKKAVGSKKLIATDDDVVWTHVAKVMLDNAQEDWSLTQLQQHDRKAEWKEANPKAAALRPGQIVELEGERYTAYEWKKNRYRTIAVNDKLLEQAIAQNALVQEWLEMKGPRGAEPTKEITVPARPTLFLIPTPMAKEMDNLVERSGALWDIMYFAGRGTQHWKQLTLTTAGLPYQLGNLMGDEINMAVFDPAAHLYYDNAVRVCGKIFYPGLTKGVNLNEFEQSVLRVAEEKDVARSGLFSELRRATGVGPTRVVEHYNRLSEFREALARVAILAHQLHRVQQGRKVQNVAGINLKGLDNESAAGKVAREAIVDYMATPRFYQLFLSRGAAPFVRFHEANLRNHLRAATTVTGGVAARYLVPVAAAYAAQWAWNNLDDDRKELEMMLPDYIRERFHIVLGKDEEGMVDVWAPQQPIDMAASWLGLDRLNRITSDMHAGKLTKRQAARELITAMGNGWRENSKSLVNPILQFFNGLSTNQDPFTRRKVMPDAVHEVFKENWFDYRVLEYTLPYLVEKIFTPIAQYTRTKRGDEPTKHPILDWLKEGPLDIKRAVGFYDFDPNKGELAAHYDAKRDVEATHAYWKDRTERAISQEGLSAKLLQRLVKDAKDADLPGVAGKVPAWATTPRAMLMATDWKLRQTADTAKRKRLRRIKRLLQKYSTLESIESIPSDVRLEYVNLVNPPKSP